MTPSEYGELLTPSGTVAARGGEPARHLKTSAGHFFLPTEIASSRGNVAKYAELLEHCVQNDYTPDEFILRLKEEALPIENEELHIELFT